MNESLTIFVIIMRKIIFMELFIKFYFRTIYENLFLKVFGNFSIFISITNIF
jgi:hypothetical protein